MKSLRILLALALLGTSAAADDFVWNWRDQQVIARNDPSVGNTSRLKEAQRAALIELIVQRLRKPMAERGYDEDRIREIATTSRVNFVDLGDGKPVVFATSVGLEGGCDAKGNCPLWVFRPQADGYVSLLDESGASYTLQPSTSGGLADIVVMRHVTARQSNLTLRHYADGTYNVAGCYVANWPAPQEAEIEDPEIVPCGETFRPEGAKLDQPKAEDGAKPDQAKAEDKADTPKTDETKAGDTRAGGGHETQPQAGDGAKAAEPRLEDSTKAAEPSSGEANGEAKPGEKKAGDTATPAPGGDVKGDEAKPPSQPLPDAPTPQATP